MTVTSFDTIFTRLGSSKFRASFHLTKTMRTYIEQKGMPVIKRHADDFISTRLAPAHISNDGKQTPMKGHPVFIAQHACAACCRGCLAKWYRVPKNRELFAQEQAAIVAVLMVWIEKEILVATSSNEYGCLRAARRSQKPRYLTILRMRMCRCSVA